MATIKKAKPKEVVAAKPLPAKPEAEAAPSPEVKPVPVNRFEEAIAQIETPGVKVEREEGKLARGGKTEVMLYQLASQPKVRTLIPLRGKEKRGQAVHTACLNGLRLVFLKGVFISLPQQVAELIEASFHGAATAGDEFDINREKVDKGVHISAALG